MSGHGYRYVGKGETWRGVPSRDLTQEQYDRLGPREQRTVDESGAWKPNPAPSRPAGDEKKGGEK